jgi:CIC family chloride channel protein
MISALSGLAARFRVVMTKWLVRFGFREETFLLFLAALIGIVTAAAAVGFHQCINTIRDFFYAQVRPDFLYGKGLILLIVIPAFGGLVVGIVSMLIMNGREAHGMIDVMESVMRASGIIRPSVAIEKIFTSAVTIGTGGSAGAEGPIVQIGAAIASGIGQFFHIARPHMPLLIGCGSAAGISAIFNAPIGGVLFTLEIILLDFSIRTFTPVVLASVIANVTTNEIFVLLDKYHWIKHEQYGSIFSMPWSSATTHASIDWHNLHTFLLLGLLCGLVGVGLTRLMYFSESKFSRLQMPRVLRPAFGGALLGAMAVIYVVLFGWIMLKSSKPIGFHEYPMPAFFGDGYGVVQQLFDASFYTQFSYSRVLVLMAALCVCKLVGTCLTLASGGSGGVIAPSLFLGATAGACLGMVLHPDNPANVGIYALVGMGAVLAAVIHAPLAAILILFETTRDNLIILPAMLASVIAVGTARLIFRDSIYTLNLRLRGVRVGSTNDLMLLSRMTVEQIDLEPASVVNVNDPLQRLIDLTYSTGVNDFVVADIRGDYAGMVIASDLQTALLDRDAVPLLLVQELTRMDVPMVKNSDDLATVMDVFARYDVSRLPVSIGRGTGKVIGLISRTSLMKKYQVALSES